MKNVTLSAGEDLIENARAIARAQDRTLNDAFREWLTRFTASDGAAYSYRTLMKQMRYVDAGGSWTRDQLNER
jgi:hypothetical protein